MISGPSRRNGDVADLRVAPSREARRRNQVEPLVASKSWGWRGARREKERRWELGPVPLTKQGEGGRRARSLRSPSIIATKIFSTFFHKKFKMSGPSFAKLPEFCLPSSGSRSWYSRSRLQAAKESRRRLLRGVGTGRPSRRCDEAPRDYFFSQKIFF